MNTNTTDVLVIDDSELAREAMISALETAGISSMGLPGPIGATREILRRRIRVVVVDVNMPAMQGDKLVSLFRQNKRFGDLKVLLTSGMPSRELEALAMRAGADDVVPKGGDPQDFVRTIQRLLGVGA